MKPLQITCAITGAETSKKNQPNLPVTAMEQALECAELQKAGCQIVHLHVRDSHEQPSQDVEVFRASLTQIRKLAPEILIQISTGGAVGESITARAQPLTLKPEMASLNMGTLNFGDEVFLNRPKDIIGMAKAIYANGIVPELEIYEMGMLEVAYKLLQQGVLKNPINLQFVLGVPGGMSGDIKNLVALVTMAKELFGDDVHWAVAGVGRFQLPLAYHAMAMGGHVRVGFEDNIYYHKNELATSNTQLVARVVRLASEMGRPLATLTQIRQALFIVQR